MLRSHSDEMLSHHTLEAAVAAEVLELAHHRNLPLNFYCDGILYARKIQPWWDLYQGRSSSPMQAVDSLLPMVGRRPTKLLFCAPGETILALRDELTPQLAGRATVLITADEYLEVMPLAADKGHALADLAARLGVEPRHVVAAGDGNNDIGMIDYAGVGIAISNGREALKVRADIIVGPPEHEGLSQYIEQNLL